MEKEVTYRVIPYEDYRIIISDKRPVKFDLYFHAPSGVIGKLVVATDEYLNDCGVVIAQSKDIHPGIPLFDIPDWGKEDDVEKVFADLHENSQGNFFKISLPGRGYKAGFKKGYNHHASTHPYSLEDMRKCFEAMSLRRDGEAVYCDFEDFLASIHQPKEQREYIVELEMEDCPADCDDCSIVKPKITDNKIKIINWK